MGGPGGGAGGTPQAQVSFTTAQASTVLHAVQAGRNAGGAPGLRWQPAAAAPPPPLHAQVAFSAAQATVELTEWQIGPYAGGMPGLTSQLPLLGLLGTLGFQVQVSLRSLQAAAVCAPRQIGPYGGGEPGSRSQVPLALSVPAAVTRWRDHRSEAAVAVVSSEKASRRCRMAALGGPGWLCGIDNPMLMMRK